MNWITIAFSMIAAASLSIAGVYLFVWLQQRKSLAYLMFVLLSISTAGIAATELWMMQTTTIGEFGTALRWFHVPICIAIFACVGFVYYRFGSSRLWLGLVGGSSGARTGARVGVGAAILTSGSSVNIPRGTIVETTLRTPLTLPQ